MAKKPICFNTKMVHALLDGNKTVTRRKIREQIPRGAILTRNAKDMFMYKLDIVDKSIKPPYVEGDILYVCEIWDNANKEGVEPDYYYLADTRIYEDYDETEWKWKEAKCMPEEAARIWLQVTGVRVERLQDMKLKDFIEEGVAVRPEAFNDPTNAYLQAKEEFRHIWESTVKEEEKGLYGWDANPLVWVIKFDRLLENMPQEAWIQ